MNAVRGLVLLSVLTVAATPAVGAQNRSPVAVKDTPREQYTRSLDRPARLTVADVPLDSALGSLYERSGVPVSFSPSRLPRDRRVSCDCAKLSVAQTLDRLLHHTFLQYREIEGHVLVFDPRVPQVPNRLGKIGIRYADVVLPPVSPPSGGASSGGSPQVAVQGTVTGQVTDAATGAPLRLANVRLEEGTRRGTVTGMDGRYRLENVPAGTHTLVATMIGYLEGRQEVAVNAGTSVTADFALSVSPARLDEVVVTATGEHRRVELGHVVGRINADSLTRGSPITRMSDLIGARVAGVQIISDNGFTGESPRIRIRGIGSISRSRDPLVYVDGVRIESSTGSQYNPVVGGIGSYGMLSGRFNDLNPAEIELIEIVKGPSAATLYGTDAANGVILIRTKRGQPGRAQWKVYFEGGKLTPGASLRPYDAYYSWGTNAATGETGRCPLSHIATGVCSQDSLTVFNPLTYPETTPIGNGARSQAGVQVSGGATQLTYFLSADYEEETGYLRMPALEVERIREERGGAALPNWQLRPNTLSRASFRGSLDARISDNADVRISSGLVLGQNRIPGNGVFAAGYYGPGFRDDVNDGWRAGVGRPGEFFSVKSSEEVSRYVGSLSANWHPRGWLSTRATLGTDLSNAYFDALQRPDEGPPGAGRNGRRLNSRTNIAQHTADLGASATAGLSPRVSTRTSLGVQYNRRNQLVTVASAANLPPGSETVTGAAVVSGGEGRVESVVAGAFFEQTLGLNDRLFFTGAVRADGGSSFGQNFNTAFYPKASASWLVSEEPFFPSAPAVNNLRLRLAYGQAGVQPGSTDALDLFSRFAASVDGVATNGAALDSLGNPHLRPERQREFEGGLDADLLESRISVEITYYNRSSTDALVAAPVAASLGYLRRWENVGSVRNWGYEAVLGLRIVDASKLKWDLILNGSVNKNRLERLGIPGITSVGSIDWRHVEGFPIFGRWARPILSFSDEDNNGIIEPNEVQVGDTLEYIGPSHPPRQHTVSTALSLLDGRLHFSTQFDHRGGHVGVPFSAVNQCVFFQSCRAVNDLDAPLSEQARAVARMVHGTHAGYIEDASFVRWRELAVTYQLPIPLARRLGASDLALSFSGRNLRLWTSYSGVDPEVNTTPGLSTVEGNFDTPTPPQTRYWIVRVDARL